MTDLGLKYLSTFFKIQKQITFAHYAGLQSAFLG